MINLEAHEAVGDHLPFDGRCVLLWCHDHQSARVRIGLHLSGQKFVRTIDIQITCRKGEEQPAGRTPFRHPRTNPFIVHGPSHFRRARRSQYRRGRAQISHPPQVRVRVKCGRRHKILQVSVKNGQIIVINGCPDVRIDLITGCVCSRVHSTSIVLN